MRNSKAILDRLVDELGDALERDRGSDSAFKAQVYQGLLRAQQAMGTCSTDLSQRVDPEIFGSRGFVSGRQQPNANLTIQRAHNPLDDDELITAHSQLRQIFRSMGHKRQRCPQKVLA
jgi:hypothetical protein